MMNSDYFRRPVSLDPTDIDFLWRNEQKALQDSREQLYSKKEELLVELGQFRAEENRLISNRYEELSQAASANFERLAQIVMQNGENENVPRYIELGQDLSTVCHVLSLFVCRSAETIGSFLFFDSFYSKEFRSIVKSERKILNLFRRFAKRDTADGYERLLGLLSRRIGQFGSATLALVGKIAAVNEKIAETNRAISDLHEKILQSDRSDTERADLCDRLDRTTNERFRLVFRRHRLGDKLLTGKKQYRRLIEINGIIAELTLAMTEMELRDLETRAAAEPDRRTLKRRMKVYRSCIGNLRNLIGENGGRPEDPSCQTEMRTPDPQALSGGADFFDPESEVRRRIANTAFRLAAVTRHIAPGNAGAYA